ncbi:MAG: prepilin-type N-terminal cleavage/methylation domain-containing protein [Actinomycetota bacterium]|nr:prepilin-type N-terminal cleavage/methylation domain-containing protein [Actinomycetota bacterium]
MNRRHLRIHYQQGFSLIELLVAMTLLLIGVAGTLSMLDRANARTVENRGREAGTALAREIVERTRSLPYPSVTSAALPGQLQAMQGLGDSDGGQAGWQIDRRGVRFTIEVSACSVDDFKDGYGTPDAASWCAGGGTGTQDRNPDDYKRVTVELTWDQRDAKGRVREQTLINSPGNAAGPAVTALTLNGYTSDTIGPCPPTCPTSLDFTATTSGPPATVAWLVDGAQQGTATGSGTAWTFTWDVSPVTDGAYLISARAFDTEGRSGAVRTRTITLNRYEPAAPRGFAAGRNGAIVDMEWLSNRERDILGYRVYRQVSGQTPEQVTGTCADASGAITRRNNCYDAAPPAGDVVYFVRAVDRDTAGALRDGAESDRVTVTGSSTPPGPVTDLLRSGTETVTLEWTAPAGSPPAAFYRIYRDGVAFANRYDRTGSGTETTWTDRNTDGQNHDYWVTAVSSQLAESTAVPAQ